MKLKSLSRAEVSEYCEKLHTQNKKIVFTNGCFDILHLGHVRYLSEARALGDFLFIGVNSDASVGKLKGPQRPIQNESDRSEILLHLKAVDAVSIFDEQTPLELIKLVKPQILVKGGDWTPDKIIGRDFVESYGGLVKSLPFVKGHSTTGLVEKILKL
ncbi:MAG: D-glycero-beta-D-manno-heptose 1-phosphate adenylyltransferase [Oligoflexia bacterium]|nr:D-glycero-beta-D-manno-heptose 1-phosphate adenylyltransferase [Oligoflexia bacterium]